MKKTDWMNLCYEIRNSSLRENEKIEKLRELAKEIVTEEKKPYVVYHWSESNDIKMGVEPFAKANTRFEALNYQANNSEVLGYFKTKLDIYFLKDNEINGYECLRYDIGCDSTNLIGHINSYAQCAKWLTEEEIKYLNETVTILKKAV